MKLAMTASLVASLASFLWGCAGESFDVAGASSEDTFTDPSTISNSISDSIASDGMPDSLGSGHDSDPDSASDSDSYSDSNADSGSADSGSFSHDSTTAAGDSGCVQHVHHDGFGGTFLDCAEPGAWSYDLARKAARSAFPTGGWTIAMSGGYGCDASGVAAFQPDCACTPSTVSCVTTIWMYAGRDAGRVFRRIGVDGCGCSGASSGWD